MATRRQHSAGVGGFIRQRVIPTGMSVTEAARRLGVGRPALSNLLNGGAALSPDMALRLETTFGADRAELLELQAASDRDRRRGQDRAVALSTYAPGFLTITAPQIAAWAGTIEARELLPVLLRQLVHSTGRELRRVDFPGYDNAQRRGWDGRVEADAASPWVPAGRSGWEFGVGGQPRAKAERDYQTRVNSVSSEERAECAFVFVTPRNWEGKEEWSRGKEASGEWTAVRALDASDLEQWLETTVAPRIWLAEKLDMPPDGFETLDSFWARWAAASEPLMSAAIFEPSVTAYVKEFKRWLDKARPDGPFSVAADSRDEAVAFLACLLRHKDVADRDRDRAVVFTSASALRTLARSSSPFLPVALGEEAERELADLYRQRHCVVIQPRNAVDQEPDVAVELLGHGAFAKALADMGIDDRDRVDRLASESGRSPTVLRRRLSKILAIRTPPWAADEKIARTLIPMTLVGAWYKGSKADQELLAALADADYNQVEQHLMALLQHDDSPVWCVGQYRGVVSKVDALFAISRWMTEKDVTDFMDFAEYVLSERDPALDLPDDQRWAAGFYGKVREHSSALRTGVCETLVVLAVHGSAFSWAPHGVDCSTRVSGLVRRLLTPFTDDKLRSHDRDLPEYAEAAPGAFLSLLEEDLEKRTPALLTLLASVSDDLFDCPARTSVLWALERLAWNPGTLMRVVNILARLSRTKIDDSWTNRPSGSLAAIFCSWLPQTAASVDERIAALEALCGHFPDIGWQICIRQFDRGQQVGHYSSRPRWRNDAAGAGRNPRSRERREFLYKTLEMAMDWPSHDATTLGDLVECLDNVPDGYRSLLWEIIDSWSNAEKDEKARAALRQRIRSAVLTRGGLYGALPAVDINRARELFDRLASGDPVRDYAWLFADESVEATVDKSESEEETGRDALDDWEEQKQRVDALRTEAMGEIWSTHGTNGIRKLLADCDAWTVGRHAAQSVTDRSAFVGVLHGVHTTLKVDDFMRGYILALDEEVRSTVITNTLDVATFEQRVRLFRCCPFDFKTWRLLDRQDEGVRERYWKAVEPLWGRLSELESAEAIDRLVEAGRPRAAFRTARSYWNKVETARLKRLLSALAKVDGEPSGEYKIDSRELARALKSLDGRTGVTVDEMAELEFVFITVLGQGEHEIPNIERKLSESPGLFVQMIVFCYGRDDGGGDAPEWHENAYRLLERAARIPGTDAEGNVDAEKLRQWMIETRRLCKECGRTDIGDQRIGALLSRAPEAEDGTWPCEPVCEVMETVASRHVAIGFRVGVFNARGAVWRGLEEGGGQERELSARYRERAQRVAFKFPYVASVLDRIAAEYGHDARWEDVDVLVRRRLEY